MQRGRDTVGGVATKPEAYAATTSATRSRTRTLRSTWATWVLTVGTEMNSFGQKLVDDFSAPELQPVIADFIDGAYFIYGHTDMQRRAGLGYQSEWAKSSLPTRRARNEFYTQIGRAVPPTSAGAERFKGVTDSISPADLLARVSRS